MTFNNDYDSQSDFSSRSIKGMHILYNNSFASYSRQIVKNNAKSLLNNTMTKTAI